jgi:tetratricopeptide (TPR) repeat protein
VREDQQNDARERYEQALHIHSESQDNLELANTLVALGDLDMSEDRLQDARGRYDQALPIYNDIQDDLGVASTLKSLADLDARENRFQNARERYEQALPIFGDLRMTLDSPTRSGRWETSTRERNGCRMPGSATNRLYPNTATFRIASASPTR